MNENHDLEIDYVRDEDDRECMRIICFTCKKYITEKHFEYVGDGNSTKWANEIIEFRKNHQNHEFWYKFLK